ncbi:hypothetical protein GQ44DRAFT_780004 [Phaeosphaeriaceae sp. PMI808]|nr:hypothetical protein GQ44DRAFT_780004 [Phaeosphaeriaceae sp. PMI808]
MGCADAKLICEDMLAETLGRYHGDFRAMSVLFHLRGCPVNDAEATLGELLLGEQPPYQTYHIENPNGQPWPEMTKLLSKTPEIAKANIVPYRE